MSTSASAPPAFAKPAATVSSTGPLLAILGIGLALRLVFLPASGFHNDLQAFEAWALTLTEHPLRDFYTSTSFADYPPGYFFVLLVVGWAYKGLVAVHAIAPDAYNVLGMLAKLPAIAMDLFNTWLLFWIAGRFSTRAVALGAAMLYAFNPAAIYVSGYWGQVDSVSWPTLGRWAVPAVSQWQSITAMRSSATRKRQIPPQPAATMLSSMPKRRCPILSRSWTLGVGPRSIQRRLTTPVKSPVTA